jgi:hypothetical protein
MLEGKFICIKQNGIGKFMTKGKVYEFKNGTTVTNSGNNTFKVTDLEEFNNIFITKLAPYDPQQPKDILTIGRIVKHRNGKMGFVLKESIIYNERMGFVSEYFENLEHVIDEWSIIEIYEYTVTSHFKTDGNVGDLGDLVWKREEKTAQQIEIERIENKMRKLADDLKNLKGGK